MFTETHNRKFVNKKSNIFENLQQHPKQDISM